MDASKVIGYNGAFATRLRELMKRKKATQQDVAAAVGTTRQAISQYADGSVQPNIEKLYKIAEYFNVSADYLLGMSDVMKSNPDDQVINKMLGLSEEAIDALKSTTSATCVNTLLEEPPRHNGTVLELLDSALSRLRAESTEGLSDADIFAIRLLRLQQAIILYKKELDEKKTNDGKQ